MTAQISRVNMGGHLGNFLYKTFVLRLETCPGGGGFEIDKRINNVISNVYWYTPCWKKSLNKLVSTLAPRSQPIRMTPFGWRDTIRRRTTDVLSIGIEFFSPRVRRDLTVSLFLSLYYNLNRIPCAVFKLQCIRGAGVHVRNHH